MAPSTTADFESIYNDFLRIEQTIAIPPYFGDKQPEMAIASYYLKTMGPGALPLQFIRIPLDEYIPAHFNNVGLGGSDLPAIYQACREFFDFPPTASPSAAPSQSPNASMTPSKAPTTPQPTTSPTALPDTTTTTPGPTPTVGPVPSSSAPCYYRDATTTFVACLAVSVVMAWLLP